MDRLCTILIWVSATGAVLVAGVFFAFSNFIMPALARIPHHLGMPAMQSINIMAPNPTFMFLLFGTGMIAIAAAALGFRIGVPAANWLAAAAAVYILGCIGVTIFANVPLNNLLANADISRADGLEVWADYLKSWTFWNSVRTVSSLISGLLFFSALQVS